MCLLKKKKGGKWGTESPIVGLFPLSGMLKEGGGGGKEQGDLPAFKGAARRRKRKKKDQILLHASSLSFADLRKGKKSD